METEGICAAFRSRFPYGKSCPNYRAVSACSAPLDRGNKARGGPIRIWLLGNGPEKTLSSPLLSFFLLLCCLHLSSPLCPSAPAAQKPSHPSCAGIRMFLADGQISGLAPVQRKERTGHANSHTETKQCRRLKIIHTETKLGGKNARVF